MTGSLRLIMSPLLLLSLLLVLSPFLLLTTAQPVPLLRFLPQTGRAPWSPRWDSNLEWYPHSLTFTPVNAAGVAQPTPMTWQGRVMIVQGNGQARTNDVWASGNLGISWYLIAGRTSNISAAGTRATTSFTPTLSRTATGVDHAQRIYRVGGNDAAGNLYNSVWLSRDGGLTWTNQAAAQGAAPFIPGRDRSSIMFDADDNVYLIGGEVRTSDYLMTSTAFKSHRPGHHAGRTLNPTPWNARGSGIFLSHRSAQTGCGDPDLLHGLGWSRGNGLYNEVWVSSDHGHVVGRASRVQLGRRASLPSSARDAANAEITKSGVMMTRWEDSRRRAPQSGRRLNDVWVSMDGGYSMGSAHASMQRVTPQLRSEATRALLTLLDPLTLFMVRACAALCRGGLCAEDATFSDRQRCADTCWTTSRASSTSRAVIADLRHGPHLQRWSHHSAHPHSPALTIPASFESRLTPPRCAAVPRVQCGAPPSPSTT